MCGKCCCCCPKPRKRPYTLVPPEPSNLYFDGVSFQIVDHNPPREPERGTSKYIFEFLTSYDDPFKGRQFPWGTSPVTFYAQLRLKGMDPRAAFEGTQCALTKYAGNRSRQPSR